MQRFSSPYGGDNDPWFRVGSVDVTTTVFVIALGLVFMVVWAIEGDGGAIFRNLALVSKDIPNTGSVLEGQVWRLITWPIPNEPDIWAIILFAVFYMLGSQLEALMGRRLFTTFLVAITVVPAVLATAVDAIGAIDLGGTAGLRFVELGVLVAFAAHYPTARFWPGIPAWGIAAAIIALEALQTIGLRDDYALVLLFCMVATSLLTIRAMGYAEDLHWLPKLPLPARMGGESSSRGSRRRRPSRRSRGDLRAVPPPPTATARVDPDEALHDMEIDALLDQVSSQGIDSLTKEQRKRLEAHAKRLRKRDH